MRGLSEDCQRIVRGLSGDCQEIVKGLSGDCQQGNITCHPGIVVREFSRDCQEVVKELSWDCQKNYHQGVVTQGLLSGDCQDIGTKEMSHRRSHLGDVT